MARESIFELAKKYYPKYWSKRTLDMLLESDKLTEEQYNEIIGEENADGADNNEQE